MGLEVARAVKRARTSLPLADQRSDTGVTPQVGGERVERVETLATVAMGAAIRSLYLAMLLLEVVVQLALSLELGTARLDRAGKNVGPFVQLFVRIEVVKRRELATTNGALQMRKEMLIKENFKFKKGMAYDKVFFALMAFLVAFQLVLG